jgi:hypothetical protein
VRITRLFSNPFSFAELQISKSQEHKDMEQPHTIKLKIGSFSYDYLHSNAIQYLKCRRLLGNEAPYSPIPYFLLCRAIELELKSRLYPVLTRKKLASWEYRHNLEELYATLPDEKKVPFDENECPVFEQASKIYVAKGFEYPPVKETAVSQMIFPDIAVLERIATKLIDAPQSIE